MKYLIALFIVGCAGSQKPATNEYNFYSIQENTYLPPVNNSQEVNKPTEVYNTTTVIKCFGKGADEQCVTITHEKREDFLDQK